VSASHGYEYSEGECEEDEMITSIDIATYFLSKGNEEEEQLTHLKLQKLLYYAQCASLAECDQPLFPGSIEAWEHGPVVPTVWQNYKNYKTAPLPVTPPDDIPAMPTGTAQLLDRVYNFFGQYSAWKLRNLTHEETAWLEARKLADKMINPPMDPVLMRADYQQRWQDTVYTASMTTDEWRELFEVNKTPSEKTRAVFASALQ
jgi:uncharacterized phage-associated protein